jgi:AsmA-like protein
VANRLSTRLNSPRVRRVLLVAGVLLLICGAVLLSLASRMTPYARDHIVEALQDKFDGDVELEAFQVSVFPRPEIFGEGLKLRHRGRTDVPPLITIKSFSASAGLLGLLGRRLRLRDVVLDGLEIHLPPGGVDGDDREEAPKPDANPKDVSDAKARAVSTPPAPAAARKEPGDSPLVITRIVSTDARLQIASSKPGKLPRLFEIHSLVLDEFGLDRPAAFVASLTNPKPEGRIETKGTFGPWQREDPRKTPIEGSYEFRKANLDTIKGIGGILSSNGTFAGVLERIDVQGTTDTPDFRVDVAGQPVHLTTTFTAVVDGTNGDTWLNAVDATFLESAIQARGAIVRAEDVKGRYITLDVRIVKARIEDLLKFALKSKKPPLTGAAAVTTKLLIPPGKTDVIEKMRLDGEFSLAEARFTNFDIQKQIDKLSKVGRGDVDGAGGESVVSNFRGKYKLGGGVLSFSELAFQVPGAIVQLTGSCSLANETLDFTGDLLLDAPLAKTTTGVKAALAKIAQPFFKRKGGGSKLPIKISGTLDKPEFGLDVKRALTPGN